MRLLDFYSDELINKKDNIAIDKEGIIYFIDHNNKYPARMLSPNTILDVKCYYTVSLCIEKEVEIHNEFTR